MSIRVGLFLASQPFDGGAHQYSQSVLHAMSQESLTDMTVCVVTSNEAWRAEVAGLPVQQLHLMPSLIDQALLKLVKFGIVPLGLWRKLAPRINRIARRVMEQQCDVWLFPSQDIWSYFLPVPAVVSIFDLMHRYERSFPEVSRGLMYFRRESHYRKLCRCAEGVLVDSEVGRSQVQQSYAVAPERIHVLPFTAPPHLQGQSEATDEALDLPQKFLFYPAQFWSHKNHLRLLQAVATLRSECPDIQLVLVGSKKNNYAAARQLIDELGIADQVSILGYVSDRQMATLYRRARALVMPTFFGPTNIPPLEAMALGCPVAVSGIYGMPEQLNGAGLLFDPQSVEQIGQAMHRLWTDDALCRELTDRGLLQTAGWTKVEFSAELHEIVRRVVAMPSTHRAQCEAP